MVKSVSFCMSILCWSHHGLLVTGKLRQLWAVDERPVHPNLPPHNVVSDKALYHNVKLSKVKNIKMNWNEMWKVFCKTEDVRYLYDKSFTAGQKATSYQRLLTIWKSGLAKWYTMWHCIIPLGLWIRMSFLVTSVQVSETTGKDIYWEGKHLCWCDS